MINALADFINILINTTSIALLIFVAAYALGQHRQEAAPQLAVTALFLCIWAIGSFGELVSIVEAHMLFWRNFSQIGVFYGPVASLLFAMAYSGTPVKTRRLLGLFAYSFQSIGVALVFTDQWLHLMRISVSYVDIGSFRVTAVQSTMLAQLLISVNFVFLGAAFLLLVIYAVRTNNSMRKQVILTAAGAGTVFIFGVVKVASGESFLPGIPISGIFGIVSLAMLLGIVRYSFLKVMPIARDEVMNIIDEGIVVASPKGEILDVNEAAYQFFSRGLPEPVPHGEKGLAIIGELLQRRFPEWYQVLISCRAAKTDITQKADGKIYHYQANSAPIGSIMRRSLGTISVMRDVTEQKNQNDLLRERAEHDGLLGILNRQAFFERAELELQVSEGVNSLAFFDVDNFKSVNDNFGHIAGDHALRKVCARVRQIIGEDALFGRTGGEEFAILFRGLNSEDVRAVAERIRAGVEQERVHHQGQTFVVTISIGIAAGKCLTMQQLYQRADRMLYHAKASGKNCCVL